MKNKILFITNQCPHYKIPLFNKLANKLNIKFIFTHENGKIKGLKANYEIVPGIGFGKYRISLLLLKILKKESPDKVFLIGPDALHLINNFLIYFYCKLYKIKLYTWVERWNYVHIPIKDKVSWIFYSPMMRKLNGIFVAGKKSYEFIINKGVNPKKIFICPAASEIYYDKKQIKKTKNKLIKKYDLKNKKVVLSLERLISRKGIYYLIEAFSKIKDEESILLVVGGGDFYKLGAKSVESKLKKQVRNLGLSEKIIFTGDVKHSETAAYYSLADLFVLPSITEKIGEAWGMVLNEAMQFGLPVISTYAVGAAYDLIENGKNGFMVKEKSVKEIKEAIEKILDDEKLRKNMGKRSEEIIKTKNNYDAMANGFLKILKER